MGPPHLNTSGHAVINWADVDDPSNNPDVIIKSLDAPKAGKVVSVDSTNCSLACSKCS